MDRFHLMVVYVAVAEEESFAKGARRLGMSPPAVTRAVALLEDRLRVKLLTRTTRFVRATDAGLRYLESARQVLAAADEADESAAGVHAAPRGKLAVTAPTLFGRMYVTPGIVDYLKEFPDIEISALFVDRVVNLMEEGMDVGVRIGDLPDSSMRAIPVGFVRRVVCASPKYLRRSGTPKEPGDLAGHAVVAASAVSPMADWKFGTGKKSTTVRVRPRLTVNSNDAAIEAAVDGFGVTRVMSYQVAAQLADGRLKRILAEHEPPAVPVQVIHQEGRQASAKVRSLVGFLVDRLSRNLAQADGRLRPASQAGR